MSIEVVLSKAPAAKPRQRTAMACRVVICAFAATGILSTNIFLPSLPTIAADLRVSSAAVTSTITVFLAIFAVGQLIVGPLSDRLGRQMPILIGLCIFVCFGAISSWIAFGPGERHFTGTFMFVDAATNATIGRVVFGTGAVIIWLCTAAFAAFGFRKFFDRSAPDAG